MFTLLMILIVACVVTRWIGAGSCGRDRSLARSRRDAWRVEDVSAEGERHLVSSNRGAPGHVGRPRTIAVETPLEKLQREFATGAITVEQYEREVGKLYGVRGEAGDRS
jgi:hypothetical protein